MSDIADRLAAAVLAHPAVVRLDGGPFGTVATALPGRRVVGVGVDARGGVEVAVVLTADRPIPAVTAELRELVRGVAGGVPVDVHVSDVEAR
ncbi:hypothetical protein [Actinokineospora sp. UTMC 2448]|uniref:hypothetical protein n=1 Tax=Actinokineospora sp. UTMC 2448 TaxID=2268449 RepID=UPI002164C5B2|nr:hypothetical protein [Actinokineospora sp. UTMC 2448]UVS78025.1 hypothetical protein Actkin_01749 [Actinokineospora sp. UTMC 2448]